MKKNERKVHRNWIYELAKRASNKQRLYEDMQILKCTENHARDAYFTYDTVIRLTYPHNRRHRHISNGNQDISRSYIGIYQPDIPSL